MKICLFTPTFLPKLGGTEVVTDALARGFLAQGDSPVVLAQGEPEELDVPYRVCWYRKPRGLQWFPERTAKALARLHETEKFDLFCVNYGHPTGYGAVRLGEKLGVPVVVVSHGGDLYRTTKDRHRPHIWKRIVHAYSHADALIAISPYIEQLIREICPSPPNLRYIPNGIELGAFRIPTTRPADFPGERPFVLCLGNLNELKGFDDAIAAYGMARTQPGLADTQLVVVGDGPLDAELRSQAAALGLADHVWFAGRRTGNDKLWFLQNCQFGLMPSIEEGHPIVGLEFLACGKPIVCTTNRAFDHMYDDGINSFRVEPKDRAALAAALIRMAGSDRGAMGACCLERSAGYTWTQIATRYLDFFGEIVASSTASSAERVLL